MNSKTASPVSRLIFGTSKPQRMSLQHTLLASAIYGAFMVLHFFEVRSGLMNATQYMWLLSCSTLVCIIFYVIIRSGLNRRLSSDPTLALPQQVFGTMVVIWTYGIAGPDRGAALGVLVLILLFGAFRFRTHEMIKISAFTLILLGAEMIWKNHTDPAGYPADVEIFHFFYALLTILPSCVLTDWTGQLQKAYVKQKQALQQALEQIQRLAESDELTGLINRRAMVPMLRSEMQARHPVDGRLCIALIDIDRFKNVNDKYGHQAGDETLRAFASLGKTALRAGDMFARWGGEEFLLMLPDSSAAQGAECVERIRAIMATANFDFVCPGFKLTLSAGIADLRPDDRLEAALERADQAMYQAKQLGRDRVVISGEMAVPARASAVIGG